jgi:hypothetical protein
MKEILQGDEKFRCMMLGRFQSDCDYYLGFGSRSSNVLWAKDEKEHIENMKALHNSFDDNGKPKGLTWEDILEYERKMLETTENEEIDIYMHENGHHWIRTHEVSTTGGEKFLHYMVKCVNCGIIGKRKDLQLPTERFGRYTDAKYEKCNKL